MANCGHKSHFKKCSAQNRKIQKFDIYIARLMKQKAHDSPTIHRYIRLQNQNKLFTNKTLSPKQNQPHIHPHKEIKRSITVSSNCENQLSAIVLR